MMIKKLFPFSLVIIHHRLQQQSNRWHWRKHCFKQCMIGVGYVAANLLWLCHHILIFALFHLLTWTGSKLRK